jgi:GTPase SAR1 family protein
MEADYAKALKQGEIPAAYARVMFLGAGGSGKSSLLDGLMNSPFRATDSTALVNTQTLTYQWIEAADAAEDAWKLRDESRGLAMNLSQVVEIERGGVDQKGAYIKSWGAAPAVQIFDVSGESVDFVKQVISDSKYSNEASRIQDDVSRRVITRAMLQKTQQQPKKNPDVVMHIWDCGGQPLFLDIMSAFLTSRTMFLLLFDASLDLNSMYQETWHHDGVLIQGREQNVTHLQLMKQWLELIHSSLVAKEEESLDGSKIEDTSSQNVLPDFPKAMIVGTHCDKITSEKADEVLESLSTAYEGAAYSDLIVDSLIVDNTTAGKGKDEDPGYKQIRQKIHKFAQGLVVRTPLAWVAFRKVMQEAAVKNPILSYSEATTIAEKCGIPRNVVPSVLHFFHQVGAMLHYATIPSLSHTVIAEPRWLVEKLRLLLMPEWYGSKPRHLHRFWKWLEERGVLFQQLYLEIWRDCGLQGGAQALADLLEHFDLAKSISQCPRDMQSYPGIKYFVPCMLKARPKGVQNDQTPIKAVRRAATLHIVFNMGYVPPGFFVRVIARMINKDEYIPLLDKVVYRDSITFQYKKIDRVTVSESLKSIRVDVCRNSKRKSNHTRFADSCVSLQYELCQLCNEARSWLPSIKLDFAFKCTCSDEPAHFAVLDCDSHQESTLLCECYTEYELSPQHKFWLPLPDPELPPTHIENGRLTSTEIRNIATAIENDVEDLAQEMEMEYSLERARTARNPLLGFAYTVISDFAASRDGTRYKLAQFLHSTRFFNVAQKLLSGEMQASTEAQGAQGFAKNPDQLKKQDEPTLLQLLRFPVCAQNTNVNIVEEIGDGKMFGVLLLNDHRGNVVQTIDERELNFEILRRWIRGGGRTPVTWGTLVEVLKEAGLKSLAGDIESSLS